MLMYAVLVKELLNNFVSCRHLGLTSSLVQAHIYLPLPPHTASATLTFITQLISAGNATSNKRIVSGYVRISIHILSQISLLGRHHPVLRPGFHISFSVNLMLLAALMKAIHNCQLCDFSPSQYCEFVLLEKRGFSLTHPCLSPSSTQFFLTRCFLYSCLKHFMMPK